MFFKVIQNKEVHIYNPKDKASLLGLKAYIHSAFKSLPSKFQLQYMDEQSDQITLASQNDFRIMLETSNKIVKIFIKESDEDYFDQTVNVVLDDQIDQLSEKVNQEKSNQREFIDMVEEKRPQEPKPVQIIPEPVLQSQHTQQVSFIMNQSKVSTLSQVTDSQIQEKFKRLLPDLIGKVKQQLVKESMIKSQIKPNSQIKLEKTEIKNERILHEFITCDGCGCDDIQGTRYKCAVCDNYDLCQKCESNTTHDHPFLKIRHPKQAPLKIFTVMKDQKQNGFEVNGKNVSLFQFPFISDIYEALFGQKQEGQQRQGFRIPQFFNGNMGYCPFAKKENKKCEQKVSKEEKKEEEKVEKKIEQKPVVVKVEQKIEQKKVQQKRVEQNDTKHLGHNAAYLASILEIDYNRCYKFAMKNPELKKEQLLELYFQNTNELV